MLYRVSGHAFYYAGGGNGTQNRTWVPGGGGRGIFQTIGEDAEPFSGGGGGGTGQAMNQGWAAGVAGTGGSGQVVVRYCEAGFGYPDLTREAQGGEISSHSKNGRRYRVHTFTGNDTFTMPAWGRVSLLVVGGGGGGGNNGGGGGGGGGVLIVTNLVLSPGTYPVTVGTGGLGGGAGSANPIGGTTSGESGGASIFANYYVPGGGYGGGCNVSGGIGASGGGGGRSNLSEASVPNAGSGREEWGGFVGCKGTYDSSNVNAYGGGGGHGSGGIHPKGGLGGGGDGGIALSVAAVEGTPGTGGGGGGGGHSAHTAAAGAMGGSGVVIIRYEVLLNGFLISIR